MIAGGEEIRFDLELDVRGQKRPLPVLSVKKSVSALEPGKIIKVLASGPGTLKDFRALVQVAGLELLELHERAGEYHFFIRKPDVPSGANGRIHYDRELDARRLSCPLPILNTRRSIESLDDGEVIKVISTDSGSVRFFQSLSRQTGLELIEWQENAGEYQFFLRKPAR